MAYYKFRVCNIKLECFHVYQKQHKPNQWPLSVENVMLEVGWFTGRLLFQEALTSWNQVFVATADDTKLRARPRPPVPETA